MRAIPTELRRLVLRRAAGRCEYCELAQEGQEATFHIDHVIPVVAGGQTSLDNLALACVSCSLRKAARQTARDPQTGKETILFNPAWITGTNISNGRGFAFRSGMNGCSGYTTPKLSPFMAQAWFSSRSSFLKNNVRLLSGNWNRVDWKKRLRCWIIISKIGITCSPAAFLRRM